MPSNFSFRPAKRENVMLLIGIAGPSGSGKTFSAIRVAAGIAAASPARSGPGSKKGVVIDTENRRALHYADRFGFDHCEFFPPFTPMRYGEAIRQADAAGYPVIVVDNFSHEWAGDGGILDWQEAELSRMAGDDYKKREACKMASWIKPKMAHKELLFQTLLTVRAHLILCFRAEEKVEMKKGDDGKWQVVPMVSPTIALNGWMPICEKALPYELTASFLVLPDRPGIPLPIKLQEQHKPLFPAGQLLDEKCGERIAQWATGGESRPAARPAAAAAPAPATAQPPAAAATAAPACTKDQALQIFRKARANGWEDWQTKAALEERGYASSTVIPVAKLPELLEYFGTKKPGGKAAPVATAAPPAESDGRCEQCGATGDCEHYPF